MSTECREGTGPFEAVLSRLQQKAASDSPVLLEPGIPSILQTRKGKLKRMKSLRPADYEEVPCGRSVKLRGREYGDMKRRHNS